MQTIIQVKITRVSTYSVEVKHDGRTSATGFLDSHPDMVLEIEREGDAEVLSWEFDLQEQTGNPEDYDPPDILLDAWCPVPHWTLNL